MREILDARQYYDAFAKGYESERHQGYHKLIDTLTIELALPYCRNKTILEVGCGTGLLLKQLAPVAKRAVGLDLSFQMAKKAQTRKLDVVLGSLNSLPFSSNSFDVLLAFKVLAHVKNIAQGIQELSRVLRPGGYLLLEFYNKQSLRYWVKRMNGPKQISAMHHEGQVFTRWDTPASIKTHLCSSLRICSLHGIRVITPAAFFHKIPGVRTVLGQTERWLRDGLFARFGGFLILVLQKSLTQN